MLTLTPNLPDYTIGKFTGLLPFKLLTLVTEGRLVPLDHSGEPILPPDLVYKTKRLREIANNLKEIPLVLKGKKQVQFPDHWNVKTTKEAKEKVIQYRERLINERNTLVLELAARIEDKNLWANYNLPGDERQRQQVFDLLSNATYLIKDIMAAKAPMGENILTGCELETDKVDITSEIKDEESAQKRQPKMRSIQSYSTPQEQPPRPEEKKPEPKVDMSDEIEIAKLESASVNTITTPHPVNFFHKKSSGIWHIGYTGERIEIKHYNGFSYIAEILRQKSGESISCITLAQMISSKGQKNVVSDDVAMAEDLYCDHEAQLINTPKARTEYQKRYAQLRSRLSEIEDLQEHQRSPDAKLEKEEIEEEMRKIEIAMKEKTFAEPNAKKAQSNIKQRLKDAYAAIRNAGMKNLASYLENNIKSDGAFGLHHTGTLTWEILVE